MFGQLSFVHLELDWAVTTLFILLEDELLDLLFFTTLAAKADQLLRIFDLFVETIADGLSDGFGQVLLKHDHGEQSLRRRSGFHERLVMERNENG